MTVEIPSAAQEILTNDPELLWQPSDPSSTETERFRKLVNDKYSLSLETYAHLWKWSTSHRSDFWSEIWDFHDVIGTKGSKPFVDESATPRDNPRWFEGAELNWAENQLRWAESRPDDVAIIQCSEACSAFKPETKRVTQSQLYKLVGRAQAAMKAAGVGKGDRVAFWGGNCLVSVSSPDRTDQIRKQ